MNHLILALILATGQISDLGRSIQGGINRSYDGTPEKRLSCDIPIPFVDLSKVEGTKETDEYLKACVRERDRQIAHAKSLIAKSQFRDSVIHGRQSLAKYEKLPPVAFTPKLTGPIEVGQFGAPLAMYVAQVIDDKNMHVEITIETGNAPITARINLEANGAIDGERVRPFPIRITGTKKYITTQGSLATIYTAKPIDLAKLKEMAEKAIVAARTREWKSGTHSVVAEFVRLEKLTITLRKQDGTEIDVPISKLSRECQTAARELAERQ